MDLREPIRPCVIIGELPDAPYQLSMDCHGVPFKVTHIAFVFKEIKTTKPWVMIALSFGKGDIEIKDNEVFHQRICNEIEGKYPEYKVEGFYVSYAPFQAVMTFAKVGQSGLN